MRCFISDNVKFVCLYRMLCRLTGNLSIVRVLLLYVICSYYLVLCGDPDSAVGSNSSRSKRRHHHPHDAKADAQQFRIPPPEWTWLGGENVGNQRSVVRGSAHQYPGSRSGSATWQDADGNLWLFGGEGYDESPTDEPHLLNDLWKFTSSTLEWQLISQPNRSDPHCPPVRKYASACGVEGIAFVVFGGQQFDGRVLDDLWVYEIPKLRWLVIKNAEHPPARSQALSWCNGQSFIIYSGLQNRTSSSACGQPSDLWSLSMKTLKWQEIHSQHGLSRNRGRVGNNVLPRARKNSVTWLKNNQTLYMFGGSITCLSVEQRKYINGNTLVSELWELSLPDFTWTLLKGTDRLEQVGQYGTLGFGDKDNIPGAREGSVGWVDTAGNLWLFGGEGVDLEQRSAHGQNHKLLSDLWMFQVEKKSWVWIAGPQSGKHRPVYGVKGRPSSSYLPGPRTEAVAWRNGESLFILGGYGNDGRGRVSFLNDLWSAKPFKTNRLILTAQMPLFRGVKADTIFLVCLCSIGGIALVIGTGFFIRKYFDIPKHHKSQYRYNVRYSPLREETEFETS